MPFEADHDPAAKSQTDVVISGVKQMILSGEIVPGGRLPIEKDLADRFSVSRGSLREGVRALAVLGVLETRQGDGTYVTSLEPAELAVPLSFFVDLQSPQNSLNLFAVRRALEGEAAALAAMQIDAETVGLLTGLLDDAQRMLDAAGPHDLRPMLEADSEFHRVVARASGNPSLQALVASLVGRTRQARLGRAMFESGAMENAVAEHRAILAELAAGQPERARVRMLNHIMGVEEYAAAHPEIAVGLQA